jgi:DNA-nicking Smr family endonuclease
MKKRSDHKKSHADRSPIKGLDADDALLWHRVTETLKPIDKKAQNKAGFESQLTANRTSDNPPKIHENPNPKKQKTEREPVRPPEVPADPPPLNQIEKRLNRRIAKGNKNFDARIDLHGMTQIEAHDSLLRFLHSAQARGCRVALVITGKGRAEHRQTHFSMHEAPGVLRRNIRGWLQQAEFRAYVAAYAQAHQRHGGDGAIYVQIRRA